MKKNVAFSFGVLFVGILIILAATSGMNGTGYNIRYGLDVYPNTQILYIAVWAVLCSISFVFGSLSYSLAQKKGHEEYFWTGFLLWLAGLVYVAGLPNSTVNESSPHSQPAPIKYVTAETTGNNPLFAKAVLNAGKTKITCMNCGKEQPKTNDICEKCGLAFIQPFM